MSDHYRIAEEIADARTWNARVALVRRIPEEFGRAHLREVYALVAERAYVPHLTPDFAYIHYQPEYELSTVEESLAAARLATKDFNTVDVASLRAALQSHPKAMRVFRLIVGFTWQELSAATNAVAARLGKSPVTDSRIKALEAGRPQSEDTAAVLAETVYLAVNGRLFPPAAGDLRSKQERPDLMQGWETVRALLRDGVPYAMFLHQRHYGGAFRQLLDATSTKRGDILEDAVEELLSEAGVGFIRTGSHNQAEIAARFHLTVQPAPDFVIHDAGDNLRALLECKTVNDGGTARDKAARFAALREAAQLHGGVPVFAVLGGLGWTRTSDALGPVIQACDGRVLTLSTLREILTVDPIASLITAA